MIIAFLKTTIKFFLKEEYPKWYGIFIDVLAALLMLATFWFTSLAFSPVGLNQQGYFDYLLIGELSLYLPFCLLFQGVKMMKRLGLCSVADQLIVARRSVLIFTSRFLGVYFLKGLFRLIIIYFLAGVLFKFPFAPTSLPTFFLIQLLAFFPFVLLSLCIGCVVLYWGRGEGLWGQVSSWLSFLSGAYFPMATFPSWMEGLLPLLNPFALFLEVCRKILSAERVSIESSEIFLAAFWFALFALLAYVINTVGLKKYKRDGAPNSYSF